MMPEGSVKGRIVMDAASRAAFLSGKFAKLVTAGQLELTCRRFGDLLIERAGGRSNLNDADVRACADGGAKGIGVVAVELRFGGGDNNELGMTAQGFAKRPGHTFVCLTFVCLRTIVPLLIADGSLPVDRGWRASF